MSDFSFAGTVPSKDEIQKNYSNLKKELEKIASLIDNLKSRLSKVLSRSVDLVDTEKNLVGQLRKALAEGKETKEFNTSLDKLRKEAENSLHEVEGLKVLISEKEQELKDVQKQISLKDYHLARSNLYSLFDLYNKQAAELAETIKKIYCAYAPYEDAARVAGESMDAPISFVYERGVPAELPAIIPTSNADISERFHWNYHSFAQEYAKTH